MATRFRFGVTMAVMVLALALLVGYVSMVRENAAPAVAPVAPAEGMADRSAAQAESAGGAASPASDVAPATSGEAYGKPAAEAQNQQQFGIQRLVVKNAELSLQVESVEKAEAALRAKIGELGGYVVSTESSGSDESASVQVSFRVPAAQFDAALSGAEGLAKKLVSRMISGEDVTEEYVDLESQLRNLEATRDRLLSFLDKATRVDDALQVNQAVTDVQGQIEQIQGRMKYLKQSAALSTISVALLPIPTTPIVDEDGWQPLQIARSALRDLLAFGQALASVAIVLGIWLPVWLPLLLLARWGWLRLRPQPRPVSPATPPATATPEA